MCSLSIVVPVLAGIFLTRMLVRAFFWRRMARGGYGNFRGGCGGGHGWRGWRRHGQQLGADFRGGGGGGQVFVRNEAPIVDVREQLSALFGSLELAEAQRDEVDDVMAIARRSVGDAGFARWTGLVAALGVVAEDTFDPIRVAGALGPNANKQLVDGMEHLHNILLPEQAEQLKAGVAAVLRSSAPNSF